MTRVMATDVKEIAEFGDLSDSEINAFISDANTIINDRVAEHVSEEKATLMEKWLAAHLAAMKEKRVSTEMVGDSEIRFEGTTGRRLEATRYGQQVLALDETGLLNTKRHHTRTVHSSDDSGSYETSDEYNEW